MCCMYWFSINKKKAQLKTKKYEASDVSNASLDVKGKMLVPAAATYKTEL